MTCCAIEKCSDPKCQVCTTTERGFPQPVFTTRERPRPERRDTATHNLFSTTPGRDE